MCTNPILITAALLVLFTGVLESALYFYSNFLKCLSPVIRVTELKSLELCFKVRTIRGAPQMCTQPCTLLSESQPSGIQTELLHFTCYLWKMNYLFTSNKRL